MAMDQEVDREVDRDRDHERLVRHALEQVEAASHLCWYAEALAMASLGLPLVRSAAGAGDYVAWWEDEASVQEQLARAAREDRSLTLEDAAVYAADAARLRAAAAHLRALGVVPTSAAVPAQRGTQRR